MNKIITAVATLATSMAVSLPAAALAAGASGPTQAVIVGPLSLTKTEDLDFGTLVRGATPGTATINANTGARTVAGGVVAAGGTPRRAEFVGAGRIGLLSLIALGAPPVLSNGAGGTMATTLTLDGPTVRLLTGTGIQTIGVGGTVTVGANQAEGDYTGTFTLTVTYL